MAKDFTVSQSKANKYKMCHYAYYLKYVEKLKRRRIKRPFQFGTIVHSMLEAHSNGDNPFKVLKKINFDNEKLFTAEKEMYGEIIADIRLIMKEYFDFWPEDSLVPQRRKGRSAEHEFNLEIEDGLVLNGKIDEVSKLKNKLKFLVEHKTFSRLPNEDFRWKNLQSALYLEVLKRLDWFGNIDGILWNYIKSAPPKEPKMLKSGELSQKAVDTLPRVVEKVLEQHKLKEKNYSKLIKDAAHNRKNYFIRIHQPVNKTVQKALFDGFIDTAREIRDTHGKKKDKNIGRHCDWCDFSAICRAELTGSDADFVKEREYYKDVKTKIEEKEDIEERG